jgi:hypothetical protein
MNQINTDIFDFTIRSEVKSVNSDQASDNWKAVVLDLMGDLDLYSVTLLLALIAGFMAIFISIAARVKKRNNQNARKLTLISALTGLGFAAFSTIFHFLQGHQSELSWPAFLKAHPSFLVAYAFCLLGLLLIPTRRS